MHADTAEEELQRGRDTLQQAEQERDEARAAQSQAPARPTQTLPDQGTQHLRQELAAAKQELEQLCSQTSVLTPTVDVAQLQSQLQEAQTALAAQWGTVPDSLFLSRNANGHKAVSRDSWMKARYRELQNQKAMMEVQLNGQLKVAEMEIDGLKKRVAQESEFSKKSGRRDNSP